MLSNVKRVVCGISGGVDSCVAALLLKNKGYEVIGAFMRNWDHLNESGHCSSDDDYKDAEWVCQKLKIPLYEINLVKEYWNEVFSEFLNDYENGIYLNPDVLCNKNIKFGHFFNRVLKEFEADAVSMGHYAQVSHHHYPIRGSKLLQAIDGKKDQTLFLCQVPQKSLQRFIFPVGHLHKNDVKEIARQAGFQRIAKRRESMGICFVGKRRFEKFIDEYLPCNPGDFIDVDTGCVVAQHRGVHHFTIGQRCRISGGRSAYYVAKCDMRTQKIFVVNNHDHPALHCDTIHTCKPHWIYQEPEELTRNNKLKCWFRTQSVCPLMECEISKHEDGIKVKLYQPYRAAAPGQFIAFYQGLECLGSGKIKSANMLSLDDFKCKKIISHKS